MFFVSEGAFGMSLQTSKHALFWCTAMVFVLDLIIDGNFADNIAGDPITSALRT